MSEYVIHIVKYMVDELAMLGKNLEIFRVYPKNLKHTYANFRMFWDTPAGKAIKIEVSNLGRIKIDGNVVQPYETKPGWWYIKIPSGGEYAVYRLVAETWCDFPADDTTGWQVHHIVNDGKNNTPANLIWIKDTDHRKVH